MVKALTTCLAIAFAIIFIALDILIIATTIQAHDQIEESKFENLADIGQNWRRGPIKAFSSNCTFPNVSAVDAEWAGTVDGCYRSGSIYRGFCSKDKHNRKQGIDVYATKSLQLIMWKSIPLCAETTGSYFDHIVVGKNENCPAGTIKCGSIDSMSNILCVNSTDSCPITQITFSDKEEVGFKSIKGKNTYLNYSNTPIEGSIPVQLKMSERNICADLNQIDTNRRLYDLEEHFYRSQCDTSVAESLVNPFFKVNDVSTVDEVFFENGVYSSLNSLPLFNFASLKTPMHLSSRSYIGINMACRERISEIFDIENKFIKLGENVEWLDDFSYIIKVLAIVFCTFDMIFVLGISFTAFDRKTFFASVLILGLIIMGFQIALLSLNLFAKNYIDEIDFGFVFIGHENCSDPITNESIILFDKIMKTSSDFFGWVWIVNVVYIVFLPITTFGLSFFVDKD